jgi:GR25 family glycosyltransferase involved in LPS biosynthesis
MHVFYINLQTRPDRRAFMEGQAARLGIAMERIEAVTPADIPQEEIASAAGYLAAGELACTYSHRAIWRLIVEQDLPAALILEDDCALADQVTDLLDDPLLLSGNIDMLQLETHPSTGLLGRPVPTAAAGISKRRMLSSCLGTCGYIITATMAKRCIDHPALPTMDLGKFLFSREGHGFLYRHRIFQSYPALAIPVGELSPASELKRSDITPTRRVRKRRPVSKTRWHKLAGSMRHAALSISAFGLGELLSARYGAIPFAGTSHLDELVAQGSGVDQ